jgi:hypothetical protein
MKTYQYIISGMAALAAVVALSASPVHAESNNCDLNINNVYRDLTVHVTPGTGRVEFTNKSETCTYKVGVASNQVFSTQGYTDFINFVTKSGKSTGDNMKDAQTFGVDMTWLLTQKNYDSQVGQIAPGQTLQLVAKLPNCDYQLDTFAGDLITNFSLNGEDYDAVGSSLWVSPDQNPFVTNLGLCVAPTPTPTPTATPTPTPTPTGQVLGATPTPTAVPTELPSTGPGLVFVTTLGGVIASLIGKKYLVTR